MPPWLISFLVSFLICLTLALLVIGAVIFMIRGRKKGKSSCGGICAHCAGCSGCSVSGAAAGPMAGQQIKIILRIDGMLCGMCASHINDCLRRSFPVLKVSSSYTRGEAVLLCARDVPDEALREAIGRTGYTLVSIQREPQ